MKDKKPRFTKNTSYDLEEFFAWLREQLNKNKTETQKRRDPKGNINADIQSKTAYR